jgi:hypothetical protein
MRRTISTFVRCGNDVWALRLAVYFAFGALFARHSGESKKKERQSGAKIKWSPASAGMTG